MAIGGYPPAHHLLRDLGPTAEVVSEAEAALRIEVTPYVCGPDGGVRAGVIATMVDVVGGAAAIRAVRPDHMATADLVVQTVRPARGPWLEANATVLRRGRTTLVVEALVAETTGGEFGGQVGEVVAWASMTFAVLPGKGEPPSVDVATELPARWAFDGGGFDRPVFEALGITVVDAAAGRLAMPVAPYLLNSFGAVQGGALALLAEAAGAEVLRAAAGPGADPPAVTGLQVAYLALGKRGPITSRATALESDDGAFPSAVVELSDGGPAGRVTTFVNVAAASPARERAAS